MICFFRIAIEKLKRVRSLVICAGGCLYGRSQKRRSGWVPVRTLAEVPVCGGLYTAALGKRPYTTLHKPDIGLLKVHRLHHVCSLRMRLRRISKSFGRAGSGELLILVPTTKSIIHLMRIFIRRLIPLSSKVSGCTSSSRSCRCAAECDGSFGDQVHAFDMRCRGTSNELRMSLRFTVTGLCSYWR